MKKFLALVCAFLLASSQPYQLAQTLQSGPSKFDLSLHSEVLAVGHQFQLYIYSNNGSSFTPFQQLPFQCPIVSVDVTADGRWLAVGATS